MTIVCVIASCQRTKGGEAHLASSPLYVFRIAIGVVQHAKYPEVFCRTFRASGSRFGFWRWIVPAIKAEYSKEDEDDDRNSGVTDVAEVRQEKEGGDQRSDADQNQKCDVSAHGQVSS